MENKNVFKGVIFVALGASFYGMLATFVKLAYKDGFTTAEVTTSQFTLGIIGLFILHQIQSKTTAKSYSKTTKKDVRQLLLAGTSYGGTSLFYYLSVQYIDVSIAIVLLMQSVWLSVALESVLNKQFPSLRKIIATVIVLIGTVFATNAINTTVTLDIKGLFWGLMAASSYTVTMFTSNKIANHLPPVKKSLLMLLGGSVLIFGYLFFAQIGPLHFEFIRELFARNSSNVRSFDFSIFYTYGLILALFGTIIPPIFHNKGFPHTGLGLGSIVTSLELPVSVTMAFVLLHEKVILTQWVGIVLILLAIVLMNWRKKSGD